MKITKYSILILVISVTLFSSCKDDFFNADPGDRVTSEQLKGLTDPAPFVNAMYSYMIQYNGLGLSSVSHNDFGYMSTVLASELWGQDMVQYGSKYGWFYPDYKYSNRGYQLTDMLIHWTFFYKLIKTTNDVLSAVPANTENADLKAARGEAYGIRAFAYLNLVELYQFTYKGNEDKLAVPIITEATPSEQVTNNPRVKVSEVYAQIIADLTIGYELTAGFVRTNNTIVDQRVIAGFLARTYLNMENWAQAAKYAAEAQVGFSVMDSKWLNEGFVSLTNPSWMWASDVNDQSAIATSGIVNYTSHISSTAYGYSLAGAMYKNISSDLYAKIPATDIRKSWWLAANTKTVTVLGNVTLPKYANLKFGYYDMDGNNFNDLCYMRVEEMILIEAEALGFTNLAAGKAKLEAFVKTRQPDFVSKATSAAELQQEVWVQRRIELWGEGFAFNDLKRLKKASIRNYTGTNHKADALFDLQPTSNFFNLLIPRSEIQNNKGIGEADNNPIPVM